MAKDKIVLITGCSSGIGLECAIEFAKASGFHVFASVWSFSDRKDLDAAVKTAGVKLDVVELDVTRETSIANAIEYIEKNAGHVDILINNAGILIKGPFELLTLAEIREQFEVNFFGTVAMTKAVIPSMREKKIRTNHQYL